MIAAGRVWGDVSKPYFLRSTDSGGTWSAGALTASAQTAARPDDVVTDDAAAFSTVGGRGRYAVLGTSGKDRIVWTSVDGLAWDRHTVKGIDTLNDSVNDPTSPDPSASTPAATSASTVRALGAPGGH